MDLDPRGSAAVLEDFYQAPLAELRATRVDQLPKDQLRELVERVVDWASSIYRQLEVENSRPYGPGTVGAVMGSSDLTTLRGAPLLSLFFETVAAPDPSVFVVVSARKDSEPDRRLAQRWFDTLIEVSPLVDAGALKLYSPFFMLLPNAGPLEPPQSEIKQLQRIALEQLGDPADDLFLPRLLMPFMHALTARRLGADIVALGDREAPPRLEGVVPPGSGPLLRLRALERVRLPNLAGASPALAAAVRLDDEACAEVREQLSRALLEIPGIVDESEREAATEMFVEGLRKSATTLLDAAAYRPSLQTVMSGALALGGGVVQAAAAGAVTPGALYAAGTAPVVLTAAWLSGRRARQSTRAAGRLLLELAVDAR